ncbi:nociceptin receptor [Patella vulgata]|uniref:nociceptin receptor n=1 Tax=Patella vulgata TaxID=6465 RepID=UPI00217F5AF2|nr:nociceptin receptor [Patella vulgata]XP_050404495.1 nociceptin receptor [Patella vulgata]XP_050404496.1 nociceptin receptor [Patella vulgata]XP_050404497.1 nociceptin receptor [Patella vulgata]
MALNSTGINFTLCMSEDEEPHHEAHQEFYEVSRMITGLILYPCICFPGLLGNILTIIVLSQTNMRTSTNAFLSALAVADGIKLINDILYFLVIVFYKTDTTIGNRAYGYLYPYAHFIFNMSVCVSSWLTVSVAVERYILVCHPTRARNVCSRKRAVYTCIAVYVVMTALALPSALRYRTIWCLDPETNVSMIHVMLTDMWKNQTFVITYTWAQNLIRSIIPLIVLVALNMCIIGALRKTRANKRNNSRHRVTVMMIMVIVVFMVCITPDAIMSTVFGFGYHEAGNLVKGVREFTDTLLALNAASNFVIYCLFNKVFKNSFTNLCCQVKSPNKFQTEMDESQYRRLSEAKSALTSAEPKTTVIKTVN